MTDKSTTDGKIMDNSNIPESVQQCHRERHSHEIQQNQHGQWFVKNHSSPEGIWFNPEGEYIGYGSVRDDDIMIEIVNV